MKSASCKGMLHDWDCINRGNGVSVIAVNRPTIMPASKPTAEAGHWGRKRLTANALATTVTTTAATGQPICG